MLTNLSPEWARCCVYGSILIEVFMKSQDLLTESESPNIEMLDHSRDFVELLCREAPGEYRRLLDSSLFKSILEQENNFNYGKLFAYAEYLVFRREFKSRFEQSSDATCIDAFSRLFLKNDISMINLLRVMENSGELEQLQLSRHDRARPEN
jgi:hypothetical protein